jgi:putative nucleotidyltransferase with HDIG domain
MSAITSSHTDARQPAANVADVVGAISNIAALPEITTKINELVKDPQSTAQDLNRLVTQDPALATRILKVVNSPFYGMPGQVTSINRAIVLLGLRSVANIMIAASLGKLFQGRPCADFSPKDLWTHSIAVATLSRLLSTYLPALDADEAFLAGLIHDIGLAVEWQVFRESFPAVVERAATGAISHLHAERAILGVDHQALGEALTAKWKFPHSLQTVAGHHHDPFSVPAEQRLLSCLVCIADHICSQQGPGYRLTCWNEPIDPGIIATLGLSPEVLAQATQQLPEALKDTEHALT